MNDPTIPERIRYEIPEEPCDPWPTLLAAMLGYGAMLLFCLGVAAMIGYAAGCFVGWPGN